MSTGSGNTHRRRQLHRHDARSARASATSGVAGVLMDGGSHDNLIGLPTLEGRNVIADVSEGVDLYSPGTDRNVIRNNLVGLSPNGTPVYDDRRQRHRPQLRAEEQHHRRLRPARPQRLRGRQQRRRRVLPRLEPGPRAARRTPRCRTRSTTTRCSATTSASTRPASTTRAYAVGRCFPGCETNDNGQGVNVIDGSNRTIVDGNCITGLRSGIAVNSPVSQGNIIRNNPIGIAAERRPAMINRYGIWLTGRRTDNDGR